MDSGRKGFLLFYLYFDNISSLKQVGKHNVFFCHYLFIVMAYSQHGISSSLLADSWKQRQMRASILSII